MASPKHEFKKKKRCTGAKAPMAFGCTYGSQDLVTESEDPVLRKLNSNAHSFNSDKLWRKKNRKVARDDNAHDNDFLNLVAHTVFEDGSVRGAETALREINRRRHQEKMSQSYSSSYSSRSRRRSRSHSLSNSIQSEDTCFAEMLERNRNDVERHYQTKPSWRSQYRNFWQEISAHKRTMPKVTYKNIRDFDRTLIPIGRSIWSIMHEQLLEDSGSSSDESIFQVYEEPVRYIKPKPVVISKPKKKIIIKERKPSKQKKLVAPTPIQKPRKAKITHSMAPPPIKPKPTPKPKVPQQMKKPPNPKKELKDSKKLPNSENSVPPIGSEIQVIYSAVEDPGKPISPIVAASIELIELQSSDKPSRLQVQETNDEIKISPHEASEDTIEPSGANKSMSQSTSSKNNSSYSEPSSSNSSSGSNIVKKTTRKTYVKKASSISSYSDSSTYSSKALKKTVKKRILSNSDYTSSSSSSSVVLKKTVVKKQVAVSSSYSSSSEPSSAVPTPITKKL